MNPITMGRHKLYVREELLDNAMAVFWKKGYGMTTVQDLERATGVNKSGLYAEFPSKEDLFVACLQRYIGTRQIAEVLSAKPQGWNNIENFLALAQTCPVDQRGCYTVNTMRELASLPDRARELMLEALAVERKLIRANLRATGKSAEALTEVVLTFFFGLCIEHNLDAPGQDVRAKIRNFVSVLSA